MDECIWTEKPMGRRRFCRDPEEPVHCVLTKDVICGSFVVYSN